MALRSVQFPDAVEPLGRLLALGRRSSLRRTGLHEMARCWDLAEIRTAQRASAAGVIVGDTTDPRALVATMMATVAQADLPNQAVPTSLQDHPADAAFDTASMARWLRGLPSAIRGSAHSLCDEAGVLTRAVLASGCELPEVLADAWITVCGHALLEILAEDPGSAGCDTEARLVQRMVASTLSRRGLVTEARISRLTGADRQTLREWLHFGPPSPQVQGHDISAPVCAALTGMTGQQWRALHSLGTVPEAHHLARGAMSWDEGEVLRWADSHQPDDCQRRCHHHHGQSLTEPSSLASVAGDHPSAWTAATPGPRLALVR